MSRLKLVVMVSGDGSNLQAILDRIAGGGLDAAVAAVVSDRAGAFALTRAERAGVPAVTVVRAEHDNADDFFRALLAAVESFAPDLVVLAGFMRVLPARFVTRFNRKIINIHPSLLPKFKGLNTHARALAAGEKKHGATVHFVSDELDSGEVIMQATLTVADDDTAESLAARVLVEEHKLYPRAIQSFAER